MTNHRVRVPATVPQKAVLILLARGYQCSINQCVGTPMLDIYEIRNADGTLRWASKDPGLFETIAQVYVR